ncbi:hypothetical protein B0A58_00740 [Flavobacterium branchiophilum NBRC 15030 = ATCC 35035]|uniref:Uncharacterized protein n=1 Tax=Flavobacterium branchiophilum TaxID=55197 RepID=A0A543FZJ4_9FLAO|nr:hypothetical protein [Flavobacterium branchiophilum]OXA81985.1 hypothetical protein B0A58_00740 [Flavobacterium branchiophilum NBRC 15030 = ATCC 35035]TQM39251.1 hypothetical protein BC670_0024 [Flavobacterium branchiophilum]GEM54114.1 hypothetical protein FB1_03350 [Flavobacterium branchiophilum NBRC 15030 = ATCC 35035]
MSLELSIPFETEEGYQYLVSFREVTPNQNNYGIPLIDVSIVLMSLNIESNSFKTLHKFIKIILDYLLNNDVIIYYYCDVVPVKTRKNRKIKLTPQEFRFKLFSTMFTKRNSEEFYLQEIILNDYEENNHYISLISKIINKEKVELIKSDIEKMNK